MLRALRQRVPARAEEGFTLIEVAFVVLIISVASFALIDALIASGRLTQSSQRQAQAVAYGQAQIEKIRAYAWNEVALTSTPAHTGTGNTGPGDNNPQNPDWYISTSGTPQFRVLDNWLDNTTTAGPGWENLVVDAANGAIPATASIPSSTGIEGTIHYYVTSVPALTVSNPLGGLVGTLAADNQRRVTVALVLTAQRSVGPHKPIWITSTITNPRTCPLGVVLNGIAC